MRRLIALAVMAFVIFSRADAQDFSFGPWPFALPANSLLGNSTGSTAAPQNVSISGCSASGNALIYTSGTGFGCATTLITGSGVANQIAMWSGTNALSGITAANNALLVTNGSGVPSLSTTAPTGIALQTPASVTLTNGTGLPISTGLTGAGTGVLTALGVNVGTAGAFVVNGGALGTPSSATLTNATGLPISTGVSGLGSGVATLLGGAATGTGGPVGSTSPSIASATLTGTATGGSAAASTIDLRSTSSGSPSGDAVFLDGTNVYVRPTSGAGGSATLNVGVPGTSTGILVMSSNGGGSMTFQDATGATGTVTVPTGTYTLAGLSAQTFTGNQTFAAALINTGITADTGHTDATVCEDTTSHQFYSGTGTAGICLGTSSLRFKNLSLQGLPGLDALDALDIEPFRMKPGYGDPQRLLYGPIAENMAAVIPSLVEFDDTGRPNRVDYVGLAMLNVAWTRQLMHRIEAQDRRIAQLEAALRHAEAAR